MSSVIVGESVGTGHLGKPAESMSSTEYSVPTHPAASKSMVEKHRVPRPILGNDRGTRWFSFRPPRGVGRIGWCGSKEFGGKRVLLMQGCPVPNEAEIQPHDGVRSLGKV